MKKNFLHFTSEVPCLIGINGEIIEKIDNINTFECDVITNTSDMFVSYTPTLTDKNYIPYTYLLDTSDTPKTQNAQIEIVPFPNNNYDIIMTPYEIDERKQQKVLCNLEVNKYFISIISGQNTQINIFSGASIVFTHNIPTIEKVKVEYQYENIIIEGIINKNNCYHLLIIKSDEMKILFDGNCNSIEKNNEYIESLKNLNDISKTAEVNKINLKTKEIEKYYVYQFNEEKEPTHTMLIPLSFLQSIQIGNENLAKKLLSENLQNTNISTLKNFFGDFDNIYFNRHSNKVGIANYTIKSNNYKNYNFILENNKIIDIQEVEF